MSSGNPSSSPPVTPNSETGRILKGKQGDPWLGASLVGLALATWFFSGGIGSSATGSEFDPGPMAFPRAIALFLFLGGLYEGFLLWRRRSQNREPLDAPVDAEAALPDSRRTLLLLITCFLIYLALLPVTGFLLSTLVMATVMMVLLGNSLWRSIVVGLALVLAIYLLFVLLFKVPLPAGMLDLPL